MKRAIRLTTDFIDTSVMAGEASEEEAEAVRFLLRWAGDVGDYDDGDAREDALTDEERNAGAQL